MILGKKDFDNPEVATKFSTDKEFDLTGKGNYTGTRKIKVEVVDKNSLKKFSVKLGDNKNIVYDGTDKVPDFTVSDAQTKQTIQDGEGTAYLVVYPGNIRDAGTVKFTIIGIGDYTGSITKSYKIKPSTAAADRITVTDPDAKYTYVSTGVTAYEPTVTFNDGKAQTTLIKGKDYTLAYSNNKKAGTAKCKINFIGNYKGIKAKEKTFTIDKFDLRNFSESDIIIPDMTSGSKEGIYKSVPYIIERDINGNAVALAKSSEFKFTYSVNGKEMKGSDGKIAEGQIQLTIEPKNDKSNYTGSRTVTYNVRKDGTDLSKAKITFNPNKPAYTGGEVTPECSVSDKNGPIDKSKYQVIYLNNLNQGKATAIIIGAPGSDCVGGKTATFTIAASNIKSSFVI